MLGNRFFNGQTSTFAYDSDAQAFFTAQNVVSDTEKMAWNAFVVGTKSDGVYSKLNTFHPFMGDTKLKNAINPATASATLYNNMYIGADGVYTGNSFGYALINIPTLTANNLGFGGYFRNMINILDIPDTQVTMLSAGGVGSLYQFFFSPSLFAYATMEGSTNGWSSASLIQGLLSTQTTGSGGAYSSDWYNSQFGVRNIKTTENASDLYQLNLGDSSESGINYSISCVYSSQGLSSTEMGLLSSRINTLMSALGRS